MESEWTSDKILELLKGRFKSTTGNFNQVVFLTQVPNGTGGFQSRWIDAAVFEMWPSRGLNRSAFEIKISRADFLNELRQPDKHQWCKDYFHYFWFLAPKDVIKEEELPTGAGWMYPAGSRLNTKRQAIRNDNPKLDDKILAAFMRAAGKRIDTAYNAAASELMKTNSDVKRALAFEKATMRLLHECNAVRRYFETLEDEEKIYQLLKNINLDEQTKQDREQLEYKLQNFENEIARLLNIFILIASKSILAKNTLGDYLYELSDNKGYLRSHIKNNKDELRNILVKLFDELAEK